MLAALVCAIVGMLVIVDVHNREVHDRQAQITESIDRMQNHIKQRAFPSTLAPSGDEAVQVLNPQGQIVTATRQVAGKPPMAAFKPVGDRLRTKRTLCPPAGLEGCMTVVAYKISQPDGEWMVYAALPVVPWYADSTLVIFLAVMTLLITAMMTMGVYRAVGRTLAPIEAIRAEMDEITATDIHRRVPVPTSQDEIGILATSVNTTLNRLDTAYSQLRRFTADASHEVRSPLTAIRAQVEEALMYPNDTDWPQMGQAVLAATERLQELVNDLLLLARLDAGAALPLVPTDLTSIVEPELDRRTSAVTVIRDLQQGVLARCDPERITRLLSNLLDNAERHATSQIKVSVRGDEDSVVVEVTDDGAGIHAEAREMVFKRFTRLDTARDRDAGGSGLGLAIARQIAEVHGGTLTIEDSEQGTRFVLRLPRGGPTGAG
ncbi:sensor histidine kinase [Actinomadura sp. HBU206391]|uniref:sensor histidine kinase n=1 Tax=Actinomadura sp. HBU206391 TaxID=2731692 RepID=UPI0021C9FD1F|nr:HAMP domain-containing sensor histidine kinase [Actinomadura sp. HBU206391]